MTLLLLRDAGMIAQVCKRYTVLLICDISGMSSRFWMYPQLIEPFAGTQMPQHPSCGQQMTMVTLVRLFFPDLGVHLHGT